MGKVILVTVKTYKNDRYISLQFAVFNIMFFIRRTIYPSLNSNYSN